MHAAALDHEAVDHAVEDGAVVVAGLDVLQEVVDGLRRLRRRRARCTMSPGAGGQTHLLRQRRLRDGQRAAAQCGHRAGHERASRGHGSGRLSASRLGGPAAVGVDEVASLAGLRRGRCGGQQRARASSRRCPARPARPARRPAPRPAPPASGGPGPGWHAPCGAPGSLRSAVSSACRACSRRPARTCSSAMLLNGSGSSGIFLRQSGEHRHRIVVAPQVHQHARLAGNAAARRAGSAATAVRRAAALRRGRRAASKAAPRRHRPPAPGAATPSATLRSAQQAARHSGEVGRQERQGIGGWVDWGRRSCIGVCGRTRAVGDGAAPLY